MISQARILWMFDLSCRPLIGDGRFCERLLVFTPDLLRKSTPEGGNSLKTDLALFDVVLSNPPYLSSGEFDVEPSISAEPRMALVAGSDGLDHIRHLMHEVPRVLKPAGVFLCEIGEGQSRKIDGFLPKPTRAQFFRDLTGIERVVQFVK